MHRARLRPRLRAGHKCVPKQYRTCSGTDRPHRGAIRCLFADAAARLFAIAEQRLFRFAVSAKGYCPAVSPVRQFAKPGFLRDGVSLVSSAVARVGAALVIGSIRPSAPSPTAFCAAAAVVDAMSLSWPVVGCCACVFSVGVLAPESDQKLVRRPPFNQDRAGRAFSQESSSSPSGFNAQTAKNPAAATAKTETPTRIVRGARYQPPEPR